MLDSSRRAMSLHVRSFGYGSVRSFGHGSDTRAQTERKSERETQINRWIDGHMYTICVPSRAG